MQEVVLQHVLIAVEIKTYTEKSESGRGLAKLTEKFHHFIRLRCKPALN